MAGVVHHHVLGDSGVGNEGVRDIAGRHEDTVKLGVGHDIVGHAGVLDGPWVGKIPGAHHDPEGEMLHPQAVDGVVTGKEDDSQQQEEAAGNTAPSSVISGIVVAIEVALDAGVSPAECGQRIRGGIAIEIIKVDHDGAATQAGGKGDGLRATGVVGGNNRLAQRDEVIVAR